MSGTLVNLTANHGLQDQIIYEKPEYSFFTSAFRRISNFAIEPLVFPTTIKSLGETAYVTIQRSGDMLAETYLMSKADLAAGCPVGAGHALVDEISLEIGGQVIDRQTGGYLKIRRELFSKYGKDLTEMCKYYATTADNAGEKDLYTPLQFFFCLSPSLYLPLISLQFHDVKLSIRTKAVANLTLSKMDLLCNMVYLDEGERKRMARQQHEMLIPTVQTVSTSVDKPRMTVDLPFNHPVKYLAWEVVGTTFYEPRAEGDAFTCVEAQLRLNHHNRFGRNSLPGSYFNLVTPLERFGSTPKSNVYAYSFSLDAMSATQPTGTCNFSRIDNSVLDLGLDVNAGTLTVYAEAWNVLRIFSGMGGLAYSN